MMGLPVDDMIADRRTWSVSVVIPCFDCVDTIERAVSSIWAQSVLPLEVILINDGQPELDHVLNDLACKYPEGWVRIFSLPKNSGASVARNKGWGESRADRVAFLDADDSWHPAKIEIQGNYMEEHPEVVLCGHDHRLVDEGQENYSDYITNPQVTKISPGELLIKNRFVTPSVMVDRRLKYRFDDQKRYMEDHLLWLQIVCDGFIVVRLESPLTYIYKPQFGASGLSGRLLLMEKGELGNYVALYFQQRIPWYYLVFLLPFSLLKFFKRCLQVTFR